MEYTIIKVRCIDQALIPTVAPTIAAGGVLEDKVIFDFCPLWDGFIKTAVFWLDKGEPYEAALDAENSCVIPFEALTNAGHMFFGVYGINADGVKRTSEVIKYKIVQGAIEGVEHGEPTPDLYEQLLERLAQIGKGEGGGAGTFIAEYDVTPFADIAAAMEIGKAVYCKVMEKGESFFIPLTTYVEGFARFNSTFSYHSQAEEITLVTYNIFVGADDFWDYDDWNSIAKINFGDNEEQLATAIKSYFAENPVEDGVSVTKVEQTTTSTADSGTNVITVTLSNGETFDFNVINGSKGSTGEKGEKGDKGDTGATGANGKDGQNGTDGVNGADGKDGVSVTHSWNGTTLTITSASGTSSANLKGEKGADGLQGIQGEQGIQGVQGEKGEKGDTGSSGNDGERGTSILSVTTAPSSYTTATGGFTPAYRIALSTVLSQSKASKALVGDTLRYSYYVYPVGYVDSSYVYLGTRVSIRGAAGAAGAAGADGYTPVKGTDYFTLTDKAEMISDLAAKLSLGIASDGLIYIFVDGVPVGTGIPQGQSGDVFGYVDENNTIVLNGNLADGTYTVKYELEDGSTVDIGGLVLSDEPQFAEFTNLFDPSTATINQRVNSSKVLTACDGHLVSAFINVSNHIPFTESTKIYLKGATFDDTSAGNSYAQLITYKAKPSSGYTSNYFTIKKGSMTIADEGNGVISVTNCASSFVDGVKYMVLVLNVKDSAITANDIKDIIITIDEPIYK